LMGKIGREAVFAHVFAQLRADLGVGQADRRGFASVGRIGVSVDDRAGEVRVVGDRFARTVGVLGGDRVDILVAAAVMGEVFEVLVDAGLIFGGVGGRAARGPVEGVVAVVDQPRGPVV